MNKTLHILLALLFGLFAVFQYNDPDPWLWLPYYILIAALSVQAARGKHHPAWVAAGLGATAVFMLYAFDGLIGNLSQEGGFQLWAPMQGQDGLSEQTREFGGALLGGLALYWLWRQSRKNP